MLESVSFVSTTDLLLLTDSLVTELLSATDLFPPMSKILVTLRFWGLFWWSEEAVMLGGGVPYGTSSLDLD